MSGLADLLDVQDHDTVISQLEHRKANLPERAELAAVRRQLEELGAREADAAARRAAVGDRQSALEREMAQVEDRISAVDKRLYSGSVTASRELQAMSAEVEQLKERRSGLEDEVLMAMEESEPIDAELAELAAQRSALDAEAERLSVAIGEHETVLDEEIAAQREQRDARAASLPADLLASYEQIRAKLGGVGAARLVGGSCSGCHLTLPAAEVDRIRHLPPDALVHCDQCGRILVR